MINQPHEKPEWFTHTADSATERVVSVNPVKKNRVAPILAIIAIALSIASFGLSNSPVETKVPATSLKSTDFVNSNSEALPNLAPATNTAVPKIANLNLPSNALANDYREPPGDNSYDEEDEEDEED